MNQTALITGASSGIGYSFATIFAKEKTNLVLVARNTAKLLELKRSLESLYSVSVHIISKDLSVANAANEIYDELKEKGIQVDYLINNAGLGEFGMFADTPWEKIDQMIAVNVTALTHLTRLFLRDMVQNKNGKILNVASTAAFQPGPTMAIYFATKAFVLHFSEAVNNEVKEYGVSVTALCPGPTQTGFFEVANMQDNKMIKDKKLPTSNEVATHGYKAMMKGNSVAIHGFKNYILANSVRFIPRNLAVKIARLIQTEK